MTTIRTNDWNNAMAVLKTVIQRRLHHHFTPGAAPVLFSDIEPARHLESVKQYMPDYRLSFDEYILLLLVIAPHIIPNFSDAIIHEYLPQGGDFAEIGGVKGANHRSMLPTGETVVFILAGNDINKRIQVQRMLTNCYLITENIIVLEAVKEGEPLMSGRLHIADEWLSRLLFDKEFAPKFSPDFPAKSITTLMDWSDLVITPKTTMQINDIKIWLDHNPVFLNQWGMHKKIKRGYRALFYGPPGTGKTLTASLLGKEFGKEVYRIDLSGVVSKYIGETEKNLEKIFAKAENKDWILFFDEADALFGKRSNVQSAHDKYANQEVSYLLQKVEDFPGLIILASNFKTNMDAAFIRRFNSIIHFPMPAQQERFNLWKRSKPQHASFEETTDLWLLAGKYELSGSAIMSVIHYASLQALHKKSTVLTNDILMEGIRREYEKEERVFA